MNQNESIEDKLKRLGVFLGVQNLPTKTQNMRYRIEDVIDTREEQSPWGSILVHEEIYPAGYLHGKIQISNIRSDSLIARWANLDPIETIDPESLLFLDTETTGLSQGTGTFVFLIGLGYYENHNFHLIQLILQDPALEPALLAVFDRYVHPYQYIVSFNGKSFDVPLLETRHVLQRIPSPFENKGQIDLLHLARKLWRNRLPSRRLGDLENQILCLTRGKEEVPGWLVPELYKEYLSTGDARPLSGVFYHNAIDVVSMAGLYVYVTDILNTPSSSSSDLDLVAIGNIFEEMGEVITAEQIYEQCLSKDLPDNIFVQTVKRFALINKKSEKWDQAIRLWQLIGQNDVEACIELAKYYEHQVRDYSNAIDWTQMAIEIVNRNAMILYDLDELSHRYSRLKTKKQRMVTNDGKK